MRLKMRGNKEEILKAKMKKSRTRKSENMKKESNNMKKMHRHSTQNSKLSWANLKIFKS